MATISSTTSLACEPCKFSLFSARVVVGLTKSVEDSYLNGLLEDLLICLCILEPSFSKLDFQVSLLHFLRRPMALLTSDPQDASIMPTESSLGSSEWRLALVRGQKAASSRRTPNKLHPKQRHKSQELWGLKANRSCCSQDKVAGCGAGRKGEDLWTFFVGARGLLRGDGG
jgi:hypothetical protein